MELRTNKNLVGELVTWDSKYQLILLLYIIKSASSPIVAGVTAFS